MHGTDVRLNTDYGTVVVCTPRTPSGIAVILFVLMEHDAELHTTLTYAMGHSVKTPCPNLKKLMVPASTAATTTIFFPDLRDGNGLVGLGGVLSSAPSTGHVQANVLLSSDGWAMGD